MEQTDYLENLSLNEENFVSLNFISEEEIPYVENDYEKIIEKEHLNKTINRGLNNIYKMEAIVVGNLFGFNDEKRAKSLEEISRDFSPKKGIKRMKEIRDHGYRLIGYVLKKNL